MQYKFNNRYLNIPDDELTRISKGLQVSHDEALQIWLEDNEYLINEEQEEMNKAKKGFKIKHDAHAFVPRERKPREIKPDLDKIALIQILHETLMSQTDNATITNQAKIIEFDYKGSHYKLDLVKQRPPKK